MRTITKRDLNQQTARVLALVDAGEPVVITERGVPRWRIESIDGHLDPVERLRAQGRITATKKDPMPWPEQDAPPRYTPADIDRLYAEMREER